ncbi:carbohydrate kinase family protein [Fusibacter bizertensis]
MYDICAIGELLIDFTPAANGAFMPNPGGAPCNFLTSAQKMGAKTAFIGKVGEDVFGKRLKEVLETQGIDTQHLILDPRYGTTLAFVHLADNGDRDFSFYRKGCADVMISIDEIDLSILDQTSAFHFGSLSFTDEPSRTTVFELLKKAKLKNILITYDPNYRAPLWESEAQAIAYMKEGLKYADIVKVSDEELHLLTGTRDLDEGCRMIMTYGIKLVCVTLGDKGCFYAYAGGTGVVSGIKAHQVDTTGAGDTFFGTVVWQIVALAKRIETIERDALEQIIKIGNTAAAICIEGYGGIPSIPSKEMVFNRLKESK